MAESLVRNPPYVMGIDAGTEAVKAGLYDLQGRRVAVGVRSYKTFLSRARAGPSRIQKTGGSAWWAQCVIAWPRRRV
jgi:sugar (pentulose or hexulose) kinase